MNLFDDPWVFSTIAASLVAFVLYVLEAKLPIGLTRGEMFLASLFVYLYFQLSFKINDMEPHP